MLQIHESIIHIIFLTCAVLMEAMFSCFNFKHDDCSMATTIFLLKIHSNITEKNWMRLTGFGKKNLKGLSSKIFLVSKMFFKKAMSEK